MVLVYSITDRKTFNNLENWLKQINDSQPENISKIIVGNKSDCEESERQVSKAEGEALANKFRVGFLESSAKDNYNIVEIFKNLGKDIKTRLEGQNPGEDKKSLKINSKSHQK